MSEKQFIMSYVRIWVHCVWGTKNHQPFLKEDVLEKIKSHIQKNAVAKKIYIDCINGHHDHIHALISLNPEQSISKVVNILKGESSFWANRFKITKMKFGWADEYYAASICEGDKKQVRNYIENQQEHHKKISWKEEYDSFIKAFTAGA